MQGRVPASTPRGGVARPWAWPPYGPAVKAWRCGNPNEKDTFKDSKILHLILQILHLQTEPKSVLPEREIGCFEQAQGMLCFGEGESHCCVRTCECNSADRVCLVHSAASELLRNVYADLIPAGNDMVRERTASFPLPALSEAISRGIWCGTQRSSAIS